MFKIISATVLTALVSMSVQAATCEIRLYRYQQQQQQQAQAQPYGYSLKPELTFEQSYLLENYTLDQCTSAFYQTVQHHQQDPALSANRVLEVRVENRGLVLTAQQELQYKPPQQQQQPQPRQVQQQQPQQAQQGGVQQQQEPQPQQNNCGDN